MQGEQSGWETVLRFFSITTPTPPSSLDWDSYYDKEKEDESSEHWMDTIGKI